MRRQEKTEIEKKLEVRRDQEKKKKAKMER